MSDEFNNNRQEDNPANNLYPVDSNPVNLNPVDSNTANLNPVVSNTANLNSVNSNPVDSDPSELNSVNANPTGMSGENSNNSQNNYGNTGNYNSYRSFDQGNAQQGTQYPYTVYPAPNAAPDNKPKKKKRSFKAFKLVASAIAFGLIAAITLQAYSLAVGSNTAESEDKSSVQVAQVTESAKDSVVAEKTSAGDVVTDVSDVVEKVMPSIVAINSAVTSTTYDFFGNGYSQDAQSSGSGIIIAQNDTNLLIATNNHVIDGAQTVEIVFADGSKASATIKGTDSGSDLAVLSVDMNTLSDKTVKAIKVATMGNSDDVKAGDMAIAIGNALGYGQSVTVGYISAVNREVTIDNQTMTLIQTDAAINPGNSGGALLNDKGEVIGINSVKYASEEVEGMGYAIPISSAVPMINELMNREEVAEKDQGYLGINAKTAQDVTELYAERFNMPMGVYVNDVIKDSPAAKAGLVQGNIITEIDGIKIKTIDDIVNTLSYKKAGQKLKLTIQQKENGKYVEKTLDITLGKR